MEAELHELYEPMQIAFITFPFVKVTEIKHILQILNKKLSLISFFEHEELINIIQQ